jgi:hypothetical protein
VERGCAAAAPRLPLLFLPHGLKKKTNLFSILLLSLFYISVVVQK